MSVSYFGKKFTEGAGILQLMDDIGEALADPKMILMGGGNPAPIPGMIRHFRESMHEIADSDASFFSCLGCYDPPEGNEAFREALAGLLRREYGWEVGSENIGMTNGSQAAFFQLFNYLAGEGVGGNSHILFPLAPEYLGYADSGIHEGLFRAHKPAIEELEMPFFKYRVDFDTLQITKDTAAICVSRPTNPTGNVLTDEEIVRLDALCQEKGIPLIIDNAYGVPFPGIIYQQVTPFWNPNTILLLSLSKLGLPGTRTGIVVASREIIEALGSINTITSLAPSSIGSRIVLPFLQQEKLIEYGKEIIEPYYRIRRDRAISGLEKYLEGIDFRLHKAEGAIFLWLWLPHSPVPAAELYRILKEAGVIVVPGHYFFPGMEEDWPHKDQCLRISYAIDSLETIDRGTELIGKTIKRICRNSPKS